MRHLRVGEQRDVRDRVIADKEVAVGEMPFHYA
jgi:hypothetical protein